MKTRQPIAQHPARVLRRHATQLASACALLNFAVGCGGIATEEDDEQELESSEAATAATNYYNGFEASGLNGLKCSGNCPSMATSPVYAGRQAADFVLTRNMPTNFRTEATLGSAGKFVLGREYWFGFAYRFEDWAPDSDGESAPFQIHQTPGDWSATCGLGSAYSTAPVFVYSGADKFRVVTYGGRVLWEGPIQHKRWLKLVVHFRPSKGADGLVEIWKDGVKLGSRSGVNVPGFDKCGLPMRDPYFKMGVYKWNWKRGPTQSSRRRLLIDELRVYQGANGYNLVVPR